MFPALQLEIMERFTEINQYFRATRRFRGESSQTAKGLVFVQIYAIHEHTIKSVVRITIGEIAVNAHPYSALRTSLLALFLDPQITSLRDCGLQKSWERRLALFERAASNDPVQPVSSIPDDGTHYRYEHIQLVLQVFGIALPKFFVRHRHAINEIVNHRNDIAHGSTTAAGVGRRYSREEIWQRLRRTERICIRLIFLLSQYCGNPAKHLR